MLHGDAIPVPMLALSKRSTKTRRLWAEYAITGRQGERAALAVWFTYSPDRKGKHPSMVPGPSAWPELEWL